MNCSSYILDTGEVESNLFFALGMLIQDGRDRGGQLFVRVFQEQRNLPHLGFGQEFLIGRHARQPDSVADLPISFARFIVAYSHDAVFVFLPQLRGGGEHVFREGNVGSRNPVAADAFAFVEAGPLFIALIGSGEGRGFHFPVDARVQRDVYDLGFHGERGIGRRDRRVAVLQVQVTASKNHEECKDNSEQKFHHTVRLAKVSLA